MTPRTMLAALAIGASLAALPALAQPIPTEQIKKIVASPERSAADRTNDLRRHPEQILEFIAIRPGIVALDVSAGGGYTTELLARSIGPTGKVYGQSRPRPAAPPPRPTNPEGNANPSATPAPASRGKRSARNHQYQSHERRIAFQWHAHPDAGRGGSGMAARGAERSGRIRWCRPPAGLAIWMTDLVGIQ